MATGDATDMAERMAAVLPARWFPSLDQAPVLAGILGGIGQAWSYCYALLGYARTQARIATASGIFLDMISADFNGLGLPRAPGESDTSFRGRISAALLREKATRPALVAALTGIGCTAVRVFEPTRPADTGAYGSRTAPATGGGYNVGAIRYGSLNHPYEVFVDAVRPAAGVLRLAVMGYASLVTATEGEIIGGYGAGAAEYAAGSVLDGLVTDDTIAATVVATLPVACTAWLRLT